MAIPRISDNLFRKFFFFIVVVTIASILLLTSLVIRGLYEEQENALHETAWKRLIAVNDYVTGARSFTETLVDELYQNTAVMSDLDALLSGDIHDYLVGRIERYSKVQGESSPVIGEYLNGILRRRTGLVSVAIQSSSQNVRLSSTSRGFFYERVDGGTAGTEYRHEHFGTEPLGTGSVAPVFSVSLQIRNEQSMSAIGTITCVFRIDTDMPDGLAVRLAEGEKAVWESVEASAARHITWTTLAVSADTSVSVGYPAAETWKRMGTKPIFVLVVALISVIVIVALTLLTVSFFLRRIHRLSVGMREVEGGNLSVRIPEGSMNDELSRVTRSFNLMCERLNEYIERSYRSEIKQRQAELVALQAQINPHFLYNTLEVIRMKAVSSGADDAAVMIFSLSQLFRYTAQAELTSTIEDEFRHCRFYLDLFRIRYKNRFSIEQRIERGAEGVVIPRVILQPIAENYIRHGYSKEKTDGKIVMSAALDGDTAVIEIRDDGTGMTATRLAEVRASLDGDGQAAPGKSIGLANVRQRIGHFFGSAARMDIDSAEGAGTIVTIRIPKETNDVPGFAR